MGVARPGQMAPGSSIRTCKHTVFPTLCSPYQNRFQQLPLRIRESSMAFWSEPRRRPYAPSPLIPNTWVPRLAFSPCFTLGALTRSIIPTCIVWSPAVGSLRMEPIGFPAEVDSSCPFGCSRICFAVFSSIKSRKSRWAGCASPSASILRRPSAQSRINRQMKFSRVETWKSAGSCSLE
jgi:hypothetical protein